MVKNTQKPCLLVFVKNLVCLILEQSRPNCTPKMTLLYFSENLHTKFLVVVNKIRKPGYSEEYL